MKILFDKNAPKKPTNLTINSDLLNKAKSLRINISAVLEKALEDRLKQQKKDEWLIENSEAIIAYNQIVDSFGVFSDGIRDF